MSAELIRHLPLAKEVVLSARQELVMRLDGYCEASKELFEEVRTLSEGQTHQHCCVTAPDVGLDVWA